MILEIEDEKIGEILRHIDAINQIIIRETKKRGVKLYEACKKKRVGTK